MSFLLVLTTLTIIIIISLSVFGGGQIFMPIFQWFWSLLNKLFNTNISFDTMANLFTISNSTPGVFSTKLAFATGYLASNGHWFGFIFSFLTYLAFILVPILIMYGAMKLITKKQTTKYFSSLMNIMNPVIAGIIGALVIQLLVGLLFPQLIFNFSATQYIFDRSNSPKGLFYDNSRKIALFIYVPLTVGFSAILYKLRCSIIMIILINIAVAMVVFHPWT
ncbi:chromate transporter [Mycoplasmopsis felifaucium]|uniref:Chromate transporter n=1 Tax=Mycoplasmopsis felifaucium TaxID=35768 RepID=A0ABZ2RQR4_9BACT|nr:chromate transporter [Mycoplasmopsis felifaucium]